MKMSFKLALLCLGLSLTYANAQVGMPTNNPNKDAVLDLNRTDGTSAKGLLLPKVALTGLTSASPMTTHVAGMHIWNTATVTGTNGVTPGEYFNDGSKWIRVSSDAWLQDGNSNGVLKAIGTNDAFDLPIETNGAEKMRVTSGGNVGIGTTAPTAKLEIKSATTNTSGLKFTNLTSSTPISAGATLGVDTAGNVVTVTGNAFVPESGTTTIPTTYRINPSTTNGNLTSITLPVTGTYLITYTVRAQVDVYPGQWQSGTAFLTTDGNVATVPNSEILLCFFANYNSNNVAIGGTYAGALTYTVTNAPQTLYLGVTTGGNGTNPLQLISDGAGKTKISYVKITP